MKESDQTVFADQRVCLCIVAQLNHAGIYKKIFRETFVHSAAAKVPCDHEMRRFGFELI